MSKSAAAGALGGSALPAGCIIAYAGSTAPRGFLLCDGSEVDINDYKDLHRAIGNSYGTSNIGVKFNLPDLRGRFLRGHVGMSNIIGSGTAGSNEATFTNHDIKRTGFKVRLSSGTLSGLGTGTTYYAIVVDDNTLAFAASYDNAIANTRISISGTNSATLIQYEDPDASSRKESAKGGSSGDALGGYQESENLSHTHGYTKAVTSSPTDGYTWHEKAVARSGTTSASGGAEARPVNVTCNYIIKY